MESQISRHTVERRPHSSLGRGVASGGQSHNHMNDFSSSAQSLGCREFHGSCRLQVIQ